MPYPIAPISDASSNSRAGQPRRPSASAAVRPPMPPPTTRMGCCSELSSANSLDLPIKFNAGIVFHAFAHGLAQCLDVAGTRATEIDQKIAMQFRHLRATDRKAAAAGGIN